MAQHREREGPHVIGENEIRETYERKREESERD